MKTGFVFPQTEIGSDPILIRDYVQAAEGMGYEYLLIYDHILGANPDRPGGWRGPYTHENTFHEPFVLFGYLAGLTQKLEFVTGILILPQRSTALVAKQAAEVDVLSGGRLRLGIGIGWNKVEYVAQGMNFHDRGKRSAEQVELLHQLWTKRLVTYEGEHHRVEDAGLNPMPVQQPIPIWFGGQADPVLERMARLGQGWMPNTMPFERAKPVIEKLHGYLESAGRKPEDFGMDIRVNVSTQSPDDWTPYIEGWRDLGATHVAVNTMGAGFSDPQEHLKMLQQFKDHVDG